MSSPLLINEPPLQVLPSLAVVVGLNEAIVLQQIHYWMQWADTRINGHVWVYNSVTQWKQQFPFWSDKTIARALASLRSSGVVVAEQLSKEPRDRSLYYRIDHAVLSKFSTPICPSPLPQFGGMEAPKLSESLYRTETTQREEAQAPATTQQRAHRLSEDWVLPKAWGEWTLKTFPTWSAEAVRTEGEKFGDYWKAKAGKDAAKLDWLATWRNWCRNARVDARTTPSNSTAMFAGMI